MRDYARIQDGVYVEFIPGHAYEVESPDWQPGDPSRIGTEQPVEERYNAWFIAQLVEITGLEPMPQVGWTYNGSVFSAPVVVQPSDEFLAWSARSERERQLRTVYDPGVMMALRALRMASTQEQIDYAEGKIAELDMYAEALIAIPDQAGFPQTIIWPIAPTK